MAVERIAFVGSTVSMDGCGHIVTLWWSGCASQVLSVALSIVHDSRAAPSTLGYPRTAGR